MHKLSLAAVLLSSSFAFAQGGAPAEKKAAEKPAAATKAPAGDEAAQMAQMQEMTKPGPNQDALKPFAKGGTFTGTHMTPDGKEMPTKGKVTCKWITGNMWVACDIDETASMGPKQTMKWDGHWVFGYDNMAKGYRGFMTDNFGTQSRMKGTLEGTKLVWESMDEVNMPNMPSKERVTDDVSDPKNEKMTFEGYMNGKWVPMGASTIKVAGKK